MIRLFLILALSLSWIGGASADSVLRRGSGHEPETLDPHKISSPLAANIILDMFEGLTAFTPDGKVEPAVAQSWTTSADGRTWTFKLRQDLKWSDGSPITSADVVYSFRRFVNPATIAPFATVAQLIVNARAISAGKEPAEKLGVAAPDAYTVVLSLENPAPYLLQILARASMVLVPRAVITKFGDEWVRPEHFVSNGAYLLKERVPNSHMLLARNPQYRAPAILDTVIYDPSTDLDAAVKRFRAGQLDVHYNLPGSQAATLQREMPNETKLVPAEPVMGYIIPNLKHPKLGDARVRRALSLALDRDAMANRILRGGQLPSETLVPEGYGGYKSPELPAFRQPMAERVKQAKALLTAAGVTEAAPLRLTFKFNGVSPETKNIGVALQAMWKPLGVIVVLEGIEAKVLYSDLPKGAFDLSYIGWRPEYPDPAAYLSVMQTGNRNNYGHYSNANYDDLIARAIQSTDQAVRFDLYRKAEQAMLDDQPIIPLYALGIARYLVATRVRGWQPNTERTHLSRYLSLAP